MLKLLVQLLQQNQLHVGGKRGYMYVHFYWHSLFRIQRECRDLCYYNAHAVTVRNHRYYQIINQLIASN